jgi:hypothetical protein
MQPLLKIQTIPINIEMRVQRAKLAPAEDSAETKQARAQVSRTRGRAYIRTTPPKVNIDSSQSRLSAGIKTAPQAVREFAEIGRADAAQAARDYAEQGNQIVDSHGKGAPIAEMASAKMISSAETIMAFIPSVPPEIEVEEGSISFDYSPDELHYDWDVNLSPKLEYIPGDIEFTVTQYPEVIIEYIGSPIYVPPSADPNYEEK